MHRGTVPMPALARRQTCATALWPHRYGHAQLGFTQRGSRGGKGVGSSVAGCTSSGGTATASAPSPRAVTGAAAADVPSGLRGWCPATSNPIAVTSLAPVGESPSVAAARALMGLVPGDGGAGGGGVDRRVGLLAGEAGCAGGAAAGGVTGRSVGRGAAALPGASGGGAGRSK